MVSDGQVTLGTTVMKQTRREDPPAEGRRGPRGLRRLGGRRLRALLALRDEARGVPRQPRALRGRARQGLAHRPDAAPARGDARRRRQDDLAPDLRHRRSHRARGGRARDRLGRPVRARRGARARQAPRRPDGRARSPSEALAIAAEICIYTNDHLTRRRALRWSFMMPGETQAEAPPAAARDAAPDRRRARQVRRRPERGEARRGDRAAQPLAAPAAARRRWPTRSRRRTS